MPKVAIQGIEKVFEVTEGEIIHDSLNERGYLLPHGCLSGSCGACRISVIEGKENLVSASAVEKNTIDALKEEFRTVYGEEFVEKTEIRLSCRAKVIGDILIRVIK